MASKAIQHIKEQHPLEKIISKNIKVITNDCRVFVGILKGLDQAMNCILSDCQERIYSNDKEARREQLGTFFLRGQTIVVMGEFVEDEEELEQFLQTKAEQLQKFQ